MRTAPEPARLRGRRAALLAEGGRQPAVRCLAAPSRAQPGCARGARPAGALRAGGGAALDRASRHPGEVGEVVTQLAVVIGERAALAAIDAAVDGDRRSGRRSAWTATSSERCGTTTSSCTW
jgi:hypothetical protein